MFHYVSLALSTLIQIQKSRKSIPQEQQEMLPHANANLACCGSAF